MLRFRNGTRASVLALSLAAFLAGNRTSAEPTEIFAERLADTATDPFTFGGSQPGEFVPVGDLVFFSAETRLSGRELWVTDGTEDGTRLVVELVPGAAGCSPRGLIEWRDLLYFEAETPGRGIAAWSTDGTAEGTLPVPALPPRPSDPPLVPGSDDVRDLVFFADEAGNKGSELFRSDGTPQGRRLVKDINPGSEGSHPDDFERVGDVVFFTARTPDEGTELWKTDGTKAGTVLVKDIRPGPESTPPRNLANLDDRLLLFYGWDADHGSELWRSDGTADGTFMVKDLAPDPKSGGQPRDITSVGDGTAYFSAAPERALRELWRTDGTEEGTYLVKDIEPDHPSSRLDEFEPVSGGVLFTAGAAVWSSNGTPGGTALFDVSLLGGLPSNLRGNGTSAFAIVEGGRLFEADGPDGPGTRTQLPLPAGASSFQKRVVPFRDGVLFDVQLDGGRGAQMWFTDGTAEGAVHVGNPVFPDGIEDDLVTLGDKLYTAVGDQAIFRTDVAPEGAGQVADAGRSSDLNSLVALGDRILCVAKNKDTGLSSVHAFFPERDELRSVAVTNVRQFLWRSDPLRSLWGIGSTALFLREGVDELWKTDGTLEGTRKIADITPGWSSEVGIPNARNPLSDVAPVRLGTRTVFAAITPENGLELWRLDDDVSGATLVKDIAPGPADSRPNGLVRLGSSAHAVFAAADPAHGMELWITDGTAEGTGLLSDIRPGPESSNPRSITISGTDLYFAAYGDDTGEEPWKVSLAGLGLPAEAFDGSGHLLPSGDPPGAGEPPLPGEPSGLPFAELDVERVRVKIDFRRDARDRIVVKGTLPVPIGFVAKDSVVVIEVEGHARAFQLNGRGRSRNGPDRFRLKLGKKGTSAPGSPVVPFALRMKGDFKSGLGSAGLTEDAGPDTTARTLRMALLFDRDTRTRDVSLDYRVRRRRGRGTSPQK